MTPAGGCQDESLGTDGSAATVAATTSVSNRRPTGLSLPAVEGRILLAGPGCLLGGGLVYADAVAALTLGAIERVAGRANQQI
jgi:hypothetical protein